MIAREYSRFATGADEPFYPIGTTEDKRLFREYKNAARALQNVIFAGQLGTYKYLDMHQAIGAALKCYQSRVRPYLCERKPLTAGCGDSEGVV